MMTPRNDRDRANPPARGVGEGIERMIPRAQLALDGNFGGSGVYGHQ